jgi:hydrogenase nickel incorporation protein HypA/HybF
MHDVHELSIACELVESVDAAARQAGATRVSIVHLRLGKLSGVVSDALQFGYDIATKGTLLEGSQLVIEELPVVIYCDACGREVALPGIQNFNCPNCGTPSRHIRQGKEMEIRSMEVEMEAVPEPLVNA